MKSIIAWLCVLALLGGCEGTREGAQKFARQH
jgi:hypothetical protein